MQKQEINKKTNNFRLNARNLFLTYPRCTLELSEAINQLKLRLSNLIIEDYLISRESHEDGTPHLHAYLKLKKPLNTYNPQYLDLSTGQELFHGKYESAKKPNHVIEYILKGAVDKFDPNILFSDKLSNRIDSLGNFLSLGQTLVKLAKDGDITKALELYEKEKPLEFIKNHNSIEKSLRQLHLRSKGFITKFKFGDYILPEELKAVLDNYNKGKTLVFIGSPGTGKTQMIISFLAHLGLTPLVINNKDSLRYFKNDVHNAIVFDDCNWDPEINREELIKLVDSEIGTSHSIKHGSIIIDNPTPRVVIGNSVQP